MYFKFIHDFIESVLGAYVTRFPMGRVEFLSRLNRQAEDLHRAYKDAHTGEAKVEYDNLFCRLAYLYMYGAAHATLFERILTFPKVCSIILDSGQNPVRIVSIGGGPSAELLGIAKYVSIMEPLEANQNCARIQLTNIDAVPQWKGIGAQIASRLKIQYANPVITYNFLVHQMQSGLSISDKVKEALAGADIVLLSYYFSDVTAERDESKNIKFIRRLAEKTSPSCLYIVIDLAYVKTKVQRVFEANNLEIIWKPISNSLDGDENKEHLKNIFIDSDIEPWTPQVDLKHVFGFVAERKESK